MSEPLPPDVRAAMDASNKIEAIRLLRAHTGLGLHDAKEAVEAGSIPTIPQAPPDLPTQLPAEAIAALQRG
ncbi:MAG: ribosomal protein L7/L12, partial [Candidatus Nitrotoga sp.]